MTATGIDHFVLTVSDVAAGFDVYESLGAAVVSFGGGRKAVQFGDRKLNPHPTDGGVTPVAVEPTIGAGDVRLLTETPVETVGSGLRERGVEIIEAPVGRTGAVAPLTSVYVRDPDGSLVEIATT
jgi:catechol 2,3-dioxygenase-like lactoylglutathione lyase family enzyme